MKDESETIHNSKIEESLCNDDSLQKHNHEGNKDKKTTCTSSKTCCLLPITVYVTTNTKIINQIKVIIVQIIKSYSSSYDTDKGYHLYMRREGGREEGGGGGIIDILDGCQHGPLVYYTIILRHVYIQISWHEYSNISRRTCDTITNYSLR